MNNGFATILFELAHMMMHMKHHYFSCANLS